MTSGDAQSEPPQGPSSPDWVSVGIGIMTIATIVAVATAAAAITIVREYASGGSLTVTIAAGYTAAVSLAAYYAVIVIGLSTLFLETASERKERTKWSASFLIFQIVLVVAFALTAIFGPLVTGVGPAAGAPADCVASLRFPVC